MATITLREKDRAALESVFRRHPKVEEVLLFGSRATGTAKRASDVDLAVRAPHATRTEWARLAADLDEAPVILEIDAIWMEDLLPGSLRDRIETEGVRIFPAGER